MFSTYSEVVECNEIKLDRPPFITLLQCLIILSDIYYARGNKKKYNYT